MITKMKQFLVGFLVCALLLGAYPVLTYGAEIPTGTEKNIQGSENNTGNIGNIENPEEDKENTGNSENTENGENTGNNDSNTDDDTNADDDANVEKDETEEKKWVVVLDPGHGGSDGGASRTVGGVSYCERDLVLKIAYYCKAELEKYDNVVVYMTRTDNTSSNMERDERAYYAASVGADVLVSFHLNATNATTSYSQSGAEVYYPNSNYKSDISQAGLYMSQSILWELQCAGVPNNGAKTRNSEDNSVYPDGTKADYLGINYWCKMYGFPGILIEHAYINNPSDVSNFLASEQGLMNLGIADAKGIMSALNSGQFTYEKGFAGRWVQSANGLWWFEYATGGWPADQWLQIWGKWYYFNKDGYMTSGWQYIDNKWYYLGASNDGAMKTGWQYINNQWYYLASSGEMCSGWQWIGGKWYYLGAENDGAMKTGWQYINGAWYYMYANGDMAYSTWIGNYYVNEWGAWTATR